MKTEDEEKRLLSVLCGLFNFTMASPLSVVLITLNFSLFSFPTLPTVTISMAQMSFLAPNVIFERTC